jgi:polyferredoxin
MQVAAAKNRWTHWALLGAILFVTSGLVALIPLFYFYPPDVVWSFVTFADDERLAASLHFIYFIFVLVIFLDVAFIRHFWCRFMCVYKVWQHGFKTKQTLHIAYDASRAADCVKCNYCVTACFIDLDPRKTDIYDSCINCGECITACNKMHAKKGEPGLLRFEVGERKSESGVARRFRTAIGSLSTRMTWTLPIAVAGIGMLAWGLWSYQPNHLAVYRADTEHGAQINDYLVAISNKRYRPERVEIRVEGSISDRIQLSQAVANFDTAGRVDLNIRVSPELAPGLYTFLVRARSSRGWEDAFRVQHFVAKG